MLYPIELLGQIRRQHVNEAWPVCHAASVYGTAHPDHTTRNSLCILHDN